MRKGYLLMALAMLLYTYTPGWAAGEEKNDLQLAVAFPSLPGRLIALALTNNSDHAVRVLTPDKGWGPGFTVRNAAGQNIRPDLLFSRPPPPTEQDYLTIAPHTTRRLQARIAPYHTLKEGTLYFITVRYAAGEGRNFTATYPYAIPTTGSKVPSPAAAQGLSLWMEYPDPTFRKLTFVLQNDTDTAASILSPAHISAWMDYIRIRTVEWKEAPMVVLLEMAEPTQADYLHIAPHTVQSVTVPVPISVYGLQVGTPYFIEITYKGTLGNPGFDGVFPYGIPIEKF